ncbi:osmotically inducible protein OsmC [Flavobacterium frigoris]|uniref:Osmotically inducible protein OsmC n=2 Tax=Flavobacterium frigoris TaxID=229204 RepID=A0A1H9K125_FLAFI|nr:osmotically inducible protein OsmC [Flavobacterium frigoris]
MKLKYYIFKVLNLSKLKNTIMKRNATAVWNGSLKEGAGKLTTQSKTLENTQYSFKSRFEEGVGTNPEELVAAAHSGCFTMQLSAYITEEGFEIESIETKCDIDLVDGAVISSHLTVSAKIKGISDDAFQQQVTKAEKNCPISKLLNAAISTTAMLA